MPAAPPIVLIVLANALVALLLLQGRGGQPTAGGPTPELTYASDAAARFTSAAAPFVVDRFRIATAAVPCDGDEIASHDGGGVGRHGYCGCLLACQRLAACVAFSQGQGGAGGCRIFSDARAWSCPGVEGLAAPRWISGIKLAAAAAAVSEDDDEGGASCVDDAFASATAALAAAPRSDGAAWGAFVVHRDGDGEARSLQTIVSLRYVLGGAMHRSIFLVDCSASGAFRTGVHAAAALGLTAILTPSSSSSSGSEYRDAGWCSERYGRALNFVADAALEKELDAYVVVPSGALLVPCAPAQSLAKAIDATLALRVRDAPNWAALHLTSHRLVLFSTRATVQVRWDERIADDMAALHCDLYFRLAAVEYAVLTATLCGEAGAAPRAGRSNTSAVPPPPWAYELSVDAVVSETASWWELRAAQQRWAAAQSAAVAVASPPSLAASTGSEWVAEKWGLPASSSQPGALCSACARGRCHCTKRWPVCADFSSCAARVGMSAMSCIGIAPSGCYAKRMDWLQLRCARDEIVDALQREGAFASDDDAVPPAFPPPESAAESATLVFLDAVMSIGDAADDGGVVWSSLARWAGGQAIDRSTDFLTLDSAAQSSAAAVWGHFGYGVHLQPRFRAEPDRVRYLTVLRDPLERIAALHHHQAAAEPIAAWLQRDPIGDDTVARQLCCWSSESDASSGARCPRNDEILECAKKRVESGAVVVGIAEEMKETLQLFEREFGIPFATLTAGPPPPPRANLTRIERDAVERYSRDEIVVYELARSIFRRNVREEAEGGAPSAASDGVGGSGSGGGGGGGGAAGRRRKKKVKLKQRRQKQHAKAQKAKRRKHHHQQQQQHTNAQRQRKRRGKKKAPRNKQQQKGGGRKKKKKKTKKGKKKRRESRK